MRYIFVGILLVLMFVPSGVFASDLDTDNIYLMGYYDTLYDIDLSKAIQEFDYVETATGRYIDGVIEIWHNYPGGRYTGVPDYEVRDGVVTNIPFSTKVHVRVKSDGWIIAWLDNEQDLGDIVFWNDSITYSNYPSNTILGQAIWRICDRLRYSYDVDSVNYYSYKYPDADRLLIGGRSDPNLYYSYSILIPSNITLYDAYFLWSASMGDTIISCDHASGVIRLNYDVVLYNKNTTHECYIPYEYTKYSMDIKNNLLLDTKNTINFQCVRSSYSKNCLFKSAVALIYKSG